MPERSEQSRDELILQVLREVLARQAAQGATSSGVEQPSSNAGQHRDAHLARLEERVDRIQRTLDSLPASERESNESVTSAIEPAPEAVAPSEGNDPQEREDPLSRDEAQRLVEFTEAAGQRLEPSRLGRALMFFAAALVGLLILIQAPVFGGVPLARALPDRQAFVIRDGLVLKGSGPEVYVLEGFRRRWISSLDAFEHYGYRWDEVHAVDDAFLAQFQEGRPLHVLLKCGASPHIYRLENSQKRWIKDIRTFEAEGHIWDDVRFVSCDRLRVIPDGPPIPPDAGPPPVP